MADKANTLEGASLVLIVYLGYPIAIFHFVDVGFWVTCHGLGMSSHSFVVEVHLAGVLIHRRSNSSLVLICNMLLA